MAFPTGWTLLQKTDIDVSSLSLGGSLANYTVILQGGQFISGVWANTDNGGGDLRFSSDQGGTAQLPCHIVRYDTTGSTADVRVRVPGLLTGTTTFYVWGDVTGTTQPARTDTYGANNAYHANYDLVLPLEGNSNDATNEENNGTDTAITYGTAFGKIGQGADFVPGSASKIQMANDASLQPGTADWSVTFWAYRDDAGSADTPPVVSSRNWTAGVEPGYSVAIRGSNGALSSHYSNGTTGFDSVDSTNVINGTGSWQFFTAIFDNVNNQLRYYKNEGTATDTIGTAFPAAVNQTNVLTIGRDQANTRQYDGKFDEIRIYRGALSTDWIKTEYFLQNDPASYITSAPLSINRSLTDSMGLSDNLNPTVTYNKSFVDSMGLTDVLNAGLLISRDFVDSMGMTDELNVAFTFNISLSDPMGIEDVLSTTNQYFRSIVDSEGLTDQVVLSATFHRSLVDSEGMTDTLSAGVLIVRELVDSMGMTDALVVVERILQKSLVGLEAILNRKISLFRVEDKKVDLKDIESK